MFFIERISGVVLYCKRNRAILLMVEDIDQVDSGKYE